MLVNYIRMEFYGQFNHPLEILSGNKFAFGDARFYLFVDCQVTLRKIGVVLAWLVMGLKWMSFSICPLDIDPVFSSQQLVNG